MRARVRDTVLYFDVDGAGLVPAGSRMHERPVAFLVHGGPGGDHSGFKGRISGLTARMQVVYFDQRGHGRSARAESAESYTLDENVEDMEALRRHLGLGSIVSIGTSYGGMVAMAHAARYPDAVSHLVLIVTAAHAGFIARSREIVAARGTAEQVAAVDALWGGRIRTPAEYRAFHETMGPLYSVRFDAVARAAGLDRMEHAPEPFNRAFAPAGVLRGFDLRPELASITAPTLIVAGRHDWITPPEFSEELHRLIPGSDLRIFEGSSHAVSADEPEALVDAIVGFLVYSRRAKDPA